MSQGSVPAPAADPFSDVEALRRALTAPREFLAFQFGTQPGAGFSAAFLGLMNRLMSCLRYGIGFRLGKVSNPHGLAIERGWTDYFLPFCGEVDGPGLQLLNRSQFPYARKFPLTRHFARAWLRGVTSPRARFFMFDEQLAAAGRDTHLWDDDSFVRQRSALARSIWRHDDRTAAEVADFIAGFDLPAQYVAVCIRRGDKIREAEYVDLAAYAHAVRQADVALPLVVTSDDSRAVEELQRMLQGREIRSIADPGALGYVHADFKRQPPQERRRRTVRYLAQVDAMRRARAYIGPESTNVSWLANMLRGGDGMMWVSN